MPSNCGKNCGLNLPAPDEAFSPCGLFHYVLRALFDSISDVTSAALIVLVSLVSYVATFLTQDA